MLDMYTLVDGKPKKEKDFVKWREAAGNRKDWIVGQERIRNLFRTKKFFVSTVFLGIDHNFSSSKKPILY